MLEVAEAQALLKVYGYGVEPTGMLDEQTAFFLRAFQLHWRPARVDGRFDSSTLETLKRLVHAAEADSAVG